LHLRLHVKYWKKDNILIALKSGQICAEYADVKSISFKYLQLTVMKSISIIGIILVCIAFSCHAQSVYSRQNLERASLEDLNFYLKQAKSKRTTGIILTAVGPVTFMTFYLIGHSENSKLNYVTAGEIVVLGTISTFVGIPILITGSSRVNRVKNALSNKVSINMAPSVFQSNLAKNHQTGLTLRIQF